MLWGLSGEWIISAEGGLLGGISLLAGERTDSKERKMKAMIDKMSNGKWRNEICVL